MPELIFNKEAFFSHLGNDLELGKEILMVYVVDAPQRVKSLIKGLEDDDQVVVIKFSHALKGISATIRAERVTALAERVERAARKGDLNSGRDNIPLLKSELEILLETIDSFLAA